MRISRDIPWPRIFAEGAAIVVSILLAFGIEAWWPDRQEQQNVREHLVALREEFRQNLGEIEQELIFRNTLIRVLERVTSADGNADALHPGELDPLLAQLVWIGQLDIGTGALTSVMRSDVFSVIEDGELQRLLAELPVLLEIVQQFEARTNDYLTNLYLDSIRANGSYAQIVNSYEGGRPGLGGMEQSTKFPTVTQRDHSNLLKSDAFLGLLVTMHGGQIDVISYYETLTVDINRAIQLIDRQIQ